MTLLVDAALTTGRRRAVNKGEWGKEARGKTRRTDARGVPCHFVRNVRTAEVAPVVLFRSPDVHLDGNLAKVARDRLGRGGCTFGRPAEGDASTARAVIATSEW